MRSPGPTPSSKRKSLGNVIWAFDVIVAFTMFSLRIGKAKSIASQSGVAQDATGADATLKGYGRFVRVI